MLLVSAAIVGLRRFYRLSLISGDSKLFYIGCSGLLGAFAGAKIFYIICEGYFYYGHPDFIYEMLRGKTILGGLIGAVVGVKFASGA